MKMTDSQRIQLLIEKLYINAPELARKAELKSAQTIYNIINGRNGLSINVAKQICKAFPHVNYSWLINGEGDIFDSIISEPDIEYNTIQTENIESLKKEIASLKQQIKDKDTAIEAYKMLVKELKSKY